MRVEEAGGSFDNGGEAIVGLDLVHVAVGVGDDGGDLQLHILGLHVKGEGVGEALGLASLDGVVVLHDRQVANDALVGGGSLGESLGGGQDAGEDGDLDGRIFLVGDFDEGFGRPAVDEAHAEDVGVREGGLDDGSEIRRLGGSTVVGGGRSGVGL